LSIIAFSLPIGAAWADDLAGQATWQVLDQLQAQQQLFTWLDEQEVDDAVRDKADEIWQGGTQQPGDVLQQVAATIALVEPRVAELTDACRVGATPAVLDEFSWLDEEGTTSLVRNNLRLILARSLVQGLYLDEALQQMESLSTENVLDPASLLFYRCVAYHRLIQKKEGVATAGRLLENEDLIPRRYAVIAKLVRTDLGQIKDGSLDDISRRMKDIERRLGLGRTAERVQQIEDEVIKMLDKLIEEEEKKQNAAAAAASSGGSQSSRPAPDSLPLGGKGPGQVTKRDIGKTAGWGELPPKEREAAMQEIGRDFPAHYRAVVEEYFRELAKKRR
jgi:hypothetical protein